MSSDALHRLLLPGLLLFALSLSLSKSASTVLIVAVGVSAIVGVLFSKEFRGDVLCCWRQPLTTALAIFCLVAYVGIIYTDKYSEGFSVANKYLSLPAIYVLVSVLLQSDRSEAARTRKAELLLFSFLAGMTALNMLGVLVFLGALGDMKYELPLQPLGFHHIWYSNFNALGVYTAVSFLLFTRHGASARGRAFLGGFLLLSVACILLSTSRTAWFSTALTAVILTAVLVRSKKKVLLAVLLFCLTFASVYRFVPLVHDRTNLVAQELLLFSVDSKAESSIGSRLLMWKAALLMFKWHPVVGVGTGDYMRTMVVIRNSRLVPKFLMRFNQPHNMYLFSMATNGIVGLTALLFIFYRSLRLVVPVLRSDGDGKFFAFLAMATTVHFMVAGSMDSFFNIQVLRYSFAFILGVCIRGSAPCGRRP